MFLPLLCWVILIHHLCRVAAGEHSRTTIKTPNGLKNVPNYALIQGIFVGCVATFIVILAILGSENHGSHFERGKAAFQVGASKGEIDFLPWEETGGVQGVEMSSTGTPRGEEKVEA